MTIITKKSVDDVVCIFNERIPAIMEGTVESMSIEVRKEMQIPAAAKTPESKMIVKTYIRYNVKCDNEYFQKEEKDIYETQEDLLAVIKANSNIV